MTCEECERAQGAGDIAYYRIGADGIGWGNIGITGCRTHVAMAIDLLNDFDGSMKMIEKKVEADLVELAKHVKELADKMEALDKKVFYLKETNVTKIEGYPE